MRNIAYGTIKTRIHIEQDDAEVLVSGSYDLGCPATLERPAEPCSMRIVRSETADGRNVELTDQELERAIEALWESLADALEIRWEGKNNNQGNK
jgi:hypothetical protein